MRNRCVEVSLLDVPPAVAADGAQRSSAGAIATQTDISAKTVAATEHVADLLSLVGAAGLADPTEATAVVAVHSALTTRRSRAKGNASSGDAPAARSLLLWAELVAASRARGFFFQDKEDGDDLSVFSRCMPLAYPGLGPGVGSASEVKIAEATLAAFLSKPTMSITGIRSYKVLECLVSWDWNEFVHDGGASLVQQDMQLLKIVSAVASPDFDRASLDLLSYVVDGVDLESAPSDLRLAVEDVELLYSAGDAAGSTKVTGELLANAAVLFARKASLADRCLRCTSAAKLCDLTPNVPQSFNRGALATSVGFVVSAMLSMLYDCPAWGEASALVSEMFSSLQAESGGDGEQSPAIASLGQAMSCAKNRWSPVDPRVNAELFRVLQTTCGHFTTWAPFMLLLDLFDALVGRRLPITLAERAELKEARARISSGRGREEGLGWLGVSCLICEGGWDFSRVDGRRGGASCPETRLARSALAPYLLPLLRAVDGLVEGLVCKEAAELVIADGGSNLSSLIVSAFHAVLEARDTLSRLFTLPALSTGEDPDPDAPAVRQLDTVKEGLLFDWDQFLVAWRWLEEGILSLRTALSASPGMKDLSKISLALATLGAVSARVDAAVLQHAGGAPPTRHTLWNFGPRAAAPSSADGAMALARLGRLADEFRILPAVPRSVGVKHGVVSLGSLMREAHPALSVEIDTRRELLHALCTLHWAASNEQVDDPSSNNQQDQQQKQQRHASSDVKSSSLDDSVSIAERLPRAFETTLKSARIRFEAGYMGTRLGAADRTDDGLEHHQDDLEFGEKFDDFDTEAAEAVANATLVVVSGGDEGVRFSGEKISGRGVLQDWALVQLSPLTEHWIAVEECQILALLADLDLSAALTRREAVVSDISRHAGQEVYDNLPALMARIARLRSAMLATPSLSPSAARPFQTLLWAWDKSDSWSDVHGPLLKRLLPVATESFGRRLWENVVGTPGSFSLQLAPPEMIAQSTGDASSDDRAGYFSTSRVSSDAEACFGPGQVLTLARSAFLLRLLATATFRSGVVPGAGCASDAIDLTLMNASARLAQFRAAVRGVRDLGYGGRDGILSSGPLKPLVQLSWSRLCRTLCCFDNLTAKTNVPAACSELFLNFESALLFGSPVVSWNQVEAPLRSALESCEDERLAAQADDLVIPAARHLSRSMEMLAGSREATPEVAASAGLGIALLGCLKLMLLLPSSPVDPGLRPALKKKLLGYRLEGVKSQLTARRWSLRLDGGGNLSPEVGLVFVYRSLLLLPRSSPLMAPRGKKFASFFWQET